jgi:transcriptional regulator with XRE-family HTH domain
MVNIAALLDKAKVIHSLKSDYKLAMVLGVSQTAVIYYRQGKTLPDARSITKICDLTGDDPDILIAEIEAQRAKTDEARERWTSIAKRLTAAAAAGIVSASVIAGPTLPASPPPLAGECILCKVGSFKQMRRLRRRAHTRKTTIAKSC